MESHLSTALWQGLGGLIGYAAASHRGFSRGIGAGFGFFAGPAYAWVLFVVSGVFDANEMRCPSCRVASAHVGRRGSETPAAVAEHRPGSLRLVFSRRAEDDDVE